MKDVLQASCRKGSDRLVGGRGRDLVLARRNEVVVRNEPQVDRHQVEMCIRDSYSPHIDKIEVNKIGVVRRARIYYLRDLTG